MIPLKNKPLQTPYQTELPYQRKLTCLMSPRLITLCTHESLCCSNLICTILRGKKKKKGDAIAHCGFYLFCNSKQRLC